MRIGLDFMEKKGLVYLGLSLFLVAAPAFPLEKIKIQCEVLEASPAFTSSKPQLDGIRYVLLHHANAADRETLSRWLKAHSGTQVTFIADNKEYKGVLFRLAHCFGRGLLIHVADLRLERRDIIEVIFPLSP
jgi:hypothetical protein